MGFGSFTFGRQTLYGVNGCCENSTPVPTRGWRLVAAGSPGAAGPGGGSFTFGKSVPAGSDYGCPCSPINIPFTFTVHFDPNGAVPGAACLLYENSFQDESLIIRYNLYYNTDGGFSFRVEDDAGETIITTDGGYHLLGSAFQITCTYTLANGTTGSDRSQYMSIYLNGSKANITVTTNTGTSIGYIEPGVPGNMNVYNLCGDDGQKIGSITEWPRGFGDSDAQQFFYNSIWKSANPALFAAFTTPPSCPEQKFGTNGDFHQTHETGPTNFNVSHCNPINRHTTTKGIGMRRKWVPALLPLPPSLPECINTLSHVSTTTTTWTVPPGVTGVLVKAQGEGGNGANAPNGGNGTVGGSGGGYGVSLLPVLPGETYTITVGSGGTGTDTLFSGPGGTVIGYAGLNYGGGGGTAVGQYTVNGGDSFVPPSYDGAAGGSAGSGAFGGAGGIGYSTICNGASTVTVNFTDPNNLFCPGSGPLPKTLTWNGSIYAGDGTLGTCTYDSIDYDGASCGSWGQVNINFEAPLYYGIPDDGNTCGNIILYGSAVHDTYAVVTGLSGSCTPGNPGAPGTLGSGGGGGGGGAPGGTGGGGGAGFIEISWGNPFGLNGFTHQTHTTTQTNFTISNCTPLNQYTTTKGIGMRRKWILGSALLPPPPPFIPPNTINVRSCVNCQDI